MGLGEYDARLRSLADAFSMYFNFLETLECFLRFWYLFLVKNRNVVDCFFCFKAWLLYVDHFEIMASSRLSHIWLGRILRTWLVQGLAIPS